MWPVATSASPPTTATTAGGTEGRRLAWVLVFLAVVSTAVASLGAPLLPTIVRADHVSLGASQWALTVSLLVGAVATPLLGRLGDGRHRRATTLWTVAAVTAGCTLSALPAGFGVLLAGRSLQGAGLALVPLATAVARDNLPPGRARRTVVMVGITTAAGVGAGYPLAGLLAQYLGLGAAFAAGAVLSAAGLAAAAAVLPPSPGRAGRLDLAGAGLLAVGVTALLVAAAEGPAWGWASGRVLAAAVTALAALGAWVSWETRAASPLVQLRLLRHRQVLSGNLTGLLVALGFYPLMSLAVRYAQTPATAGYGLGASAVVAGALLTPFSAASFLVRRPAIFLARRASPNWVVVASTVVLAAGQILFLLDRSGYPAVVAAMAMTGAGVGGVFAVNPIQIVDGVPANETGSSLSFYQLVRTVAYSVGSVLSATLLVAGTPAGSHLPTNAGYSAAALADLTVLACAFLAGLVLALTEPSTTDTRDPDP